MFLQENVWRNVDLNSRCSLESGMFNRFMLLEQRSHVTIVHRNELRHFCKNCISNKHLYVTVLVFERTEIRYVHIPSSSRD